MESENADRTPCCGRILWAHNARHLSLIEAYVLAKFQDDTRIKTYDPVGGLAASLPTWNKTANNRKEVHRCVDKLREKSEAG